MSVAVFAWLLALLYGALVRARRRRRLVLVPVAVVILALSLMGALFALLVAGFTCWDDCDEYSDKWWDSPDSWQWNGQLVPAAVGLIAATAGLALTIARKPGPAVGAIALAALAFSVWGIMLGPLA